MKMRWIIFVLMLTASLAFAQTSAGTKANTKQSTPFSKKTAKTTKTAAPKTMAPKATTPKTMTSKAAAPSASKAKTAKVKPAVKPATTAAATSKANKVAKPKAVKKEKPAAAPAAPETASTEAGPGTGRKRDLCSTGVRCLAVNEIVLRGVVKSANGMIAVVENAAQKTYFLHENQPIYNGFVERITPDSVIFKEHYLDNLGHDSQREVVKTVNAPVV